MNTTTAVPLATWTAKGSFEIGRTMWNGAIRDYFPGSIDDVHAYQEVLTADDMTGLADEQILD